MRRTAVPGGRAIGTAKQEASERAKVRAHIRRVSRRSVFRKKQATHADSATRASTSFRADLPSVKLADIEKEIGAGQRSGYEQEIKTTARKPTRQRGSEPGMEAWYSYARWTKGGRKGTGAAESVWKASGQGESGEEVWIRNGHWRQEQPMGGGITRKRQTLITKGVKMWKKSAVG